MDFRCNFEMKCQKSKLCDVQIVDKCNTQEPAVQQQVGAGRLLGWLSLSHLCVLQVFLSNLHTFMPLRKDCLSSLYSPYPRSPLSPSTLWYDSPPPPLTHSLTHSLLDSSSIVFLIVLVVPSMYQKYIACPSYCTVEYSDHSVVRKSADNSRRHCYG